MSSGALALLSTDRVETLLHDGTPALCRPIGPEDRHLIRQGFESLSEQSRLRRFLVPTSVLTEHELDYLTHLDNWDHLAWGALRVDRPTEGMGVARYIRLRAEPTVAEAAITVLDEYQHQGLGTFLLGLLTAAALTAGILTFRAYVLEENLPIRNLLEALGARAEFDSPGVLRMDFPLEPERMPDTRVARALKAAAARVFPEPGRFGP